MIAALLMLAVPMEQRFDCTPIRIWDGDGPIWCAEGPRVRLRDIAARELDGSCRHGHPCPRASGVEARDALLRLLGGSRGVTSDGHVIVRAPKMRCVTPGKDRYGRTVARCRVRGVGDLGEALIRVGVALAWPWK